MPRHSAANGGPPGRPNDPTLLILTSLASGPKHGYALTKDIETFAGASLGPGTLYGAVSRLERQGLIEPLAGDERRRPYGITGAGREYLATTLASMRKVVDEGTARLGTGAGGLVRPGHTIGGPALSGRQA
jgi:DNA-binding PadR family transcriptional regulator